MLFRDRKIIEDGLDGAELSQISYETEFDYEAFGFKNHYPEINNKDQQCHILSDKKETTIVFPGTNVKEPEDIRLDFSIKYDPNIITIGIHEGVNKGLNYMWSEIVDVLSMDNFRNRPINIRGHSLGAGYATECSSRLAGEGVVSIHTYGGFKVYDCRGHALYPHHDIHYTWINCADFVSRFPWRRCREEHVGNILYMERNGEVEDDVSGWEFWADYFMSPGIRILEHLIENYITTFKGIKI